MLVAATNPCPCGYAGAGDRCQCAEADLRRHRRRLSGPLLDRIDLLIDVQRPSELELRSPPVTSSAQAAVRVTEARDRQLLRLVGTGRRCNDEMDAALVRRHVRLDDGAHSVLGRAYTTGSLSARGRHRVLRVARTVADLAGRDRVTQADVLTALSLRRRGASDAEVAA
jgi:magnesium chelatase family protein